MSWSDLTGADWAAATVAIPHTTSTETAACRNNVFIMARIVDRGVGRRKSAVSLAAYLRGVGRAEAADPRAGGTHNSSLRPDVWRRSIGGSTPSALHLYQRGHPLQRDDLAGPLPARPDRVVLACGQ